MYNSNPNLCTTYTIYPEPNSVPNKSSYRELKL